MRLNLGNRRQEPRPSNDVATRLSHPCDSHLTMPKASSRQQTERRNNRVVHGTGIVASSKTPLLSPRSEVVANNPSDVSYLAPLSIASTKHTAISSARLPTYRTQRGQPTPLKW